MVDDELDDPLPSAMACHLRSPVVFPGFDEFLRFDRQQEQRIPQIEKAGSKETWAEWGLGQKNTDAEISQHWFDVKDQSHGKRKGCELVQSNCRVCLEHSIITQDLGPLRLSHPHLCDLEKNVPADILSGMLFDVLFFSNNLHVSTSFLAYGLQFI